MVGGIGGPGGPKRIEGGPSSVGGPEHLGNPKVPGKPSAPAKPDTIEKNIKTIHSGSFPRVITESAERGLYPKISDVNLSKQQSALVVGAILKRLYGG